MSETKEVWPFPRSPEAQAAVIAATNMKVKEKLTPEQIEARKESARAIKSETLLADPNSPQNRAARSAVVNSVVADRGLVVHALNEKKFYLNENDASLSSEYLGPKNVVIVYKPYIDGGKLNLMYALSYCHPGDKFDFLLGKEVAVQRWVDAKVEVASYPLSSLFGIVDDDSQILVKRYMLNQFGSNSAASRIEKTIKAEALAKTLIELEELENSDFIF